MRPVDLALLVLLSPAHTLAHHGSAYYYDIDNLASTEDEALAMSWRNPHVMLEIGRVWSRPRMQGQLLAELERELPYTAAARAAQATWNPLADDPFLKCTPRGMPSIMNNSLPIEFVDQGDIILLRLEEWDGRRTIHMTSDARKKGPGPFS